MLLVNGIPLVVIEAKTPVRSSQSWLDGALQVHDDYERNVPELFVPNVFSVATEGKEFRYGSIGLPVELWGPWRIEADARTPALQQIEKAVASMLRPHVVLDLLANFTAYATDKKKRRIKIIARYQQYEGANKIVERVVAGHPKKGLIWHFQGSGKSLLMLFAARKLRLHPALKNPTVIIVVDRIDLDTQISSTFYAADMPNLVKADTRAELQRLLAQDVRKIIITTIFKFGEADGVLNDRGNIIAMVDEAHRTQEGDLGRKMREALPNAFLFGLTGTPINRADRNTFYAFGADEDERGYMSRYGFEESIRDGATMPLHFEPRLLELHIDKEAIDQAFKELTGGLSDLDRDQLAKTAAKMAVLVKAPERIQTICADIARHFQEKVAPNGFGAQVVTFDRESCVLYKQALDEYLPPEASDIVMSVNSGEDEYAPYRRDRDAEEKLLDRFRDPADPLKILIVTSKLLTGFDAPILQAMYLDKPLRDHTLLQAICRTNRPYGEAKTHGLIVDYLGVFDDVAQALQFDEEGITRVVANISELVGKLPEAVQKCLAYFPGVDRTVSGLRGADRRAGLPAQQRHARPLRRRLQLPGPPLGGDLARSGPEPARDRLPLARAGLRVGEAFDRHRQAALARARGEDDRADPRARPRRRRPRRPRHAGPGRRPARSRARDARSRQEGQGDRDQGRAAPAQASARPALQGAGRAARGTEGAARAGTARQHRLPEGAARARPRRRRGGATPPSRSKTKTRGKAALTELFEEARNEETPIMVERVVDDIDEIVRYVRFDGWQNTHAGEREVKMALRKTLFKYKLHQDQELFDRAYGYIRQYY